MFAKYSHSGPGNFKVRGKEDEEEVTKMLDELQIENGPRKLVIENIRWKQALETQQGQFERKLEMYTDTREIARVLKSKSGAVDLHWDLLQVQCNVLMHM